MEQGTNEWKQIRLGKVSASRMSDLLATTKSGSSAATRSKYMAQLVVERMTGVPTEFKITKPMERGTELEPIARAAYEVKTNQMVDQIAWVNHPTIENAGCSPDGLIGEDGLVEIKCKETHNHFESILNDEIDSDHAKQMLWQMACTGRKWCDYVCFDDRAPEGLQLFVKRLHRDDEKIKTMEAEVVKFLKELDELENKLKEKAKNGISQ
jgi:putative phage-type endonuclease